MKKLFTFFLVLIAATSMIFAQSANNEDEVIKIDKWNQNAYREGEILVKFKADGAVQMRAPRKAKFATSQVNTIDVLFEELGVDSIEQLMPMTGHKNVGRRVRAYNGSDVEVKDLSKLYRLTLKAEKAQTMFEAIEKLKEQREVEFAEPNYIVYTMALPYNDSIPAADSAVYVNEPLYSQQWGLEAINLPALWNKPKRTNKRPVIAILDTGVDIEHPDLAANIWTNTTEANGVANQDDDANGFKDDIHGWDFINNHSVTNDFNGHGTHCAGIAAAVGNNGIGITGANPDALIMPVTVMQSNGTGDIATIIKGIDYAAGNGADVINMSFGGYGYSIAEEQALGRAYANAVLVAAAGNDALWCDILMRHVCHSKQGPPRVTFPAGFTFVLGVEASDMNGCDASFSNVDGHPIYSNYGEEQLYNYELCAPGVNILSTFPGGRYKKLNGTSMSCPLAAGAISRLIQCKEILSKELLFGDLIHMRPNLQGNIDMLATYNITDADRLPELALVTVNLMDTASGDGDMRADAGETIELYPVFKNAWGQAKNIRFWGRTGYFADDDWVWDDTTLIQHLQDTAYFGKPLSSYAKATSINPWRISVSPNCSDGRQINLTIFAICDNSSDTLRQQIILTVENGVELKGVLNDTLVLFPDQHYIVNQNYAISNTGVLIVKPGVVLKLKEGVSFSSSGRIYAVGTPDSMITITKADLGGNWRVMTLNRFDTLRYCKIEYGSYIDKMYLAYLSDCTIQESSVGDLPTIRWGEWARCNIFYNGISSINFASAPSRTYAFNIINNSGKQPINTYRAINISDDQEGEKIGFNNSNIFSNEPYSFLDLQSSFITVKNNTIYWGSSNVDIVKAREIFDFDRPNSGTFVWLNLEHMRTTPSAEAHGIVWKILIDGIDAQDEFELLPPLGVGTHRCDVYFNRPMDTSIPPFISHGVRPPYTQRQITDNGSWSEDSTIYTAYFTIDAKSVTDGLNRLYVADAQDREHFEIPIENKRFNMEIAAAGSMSTGLMAEAGLGKVTLSWETDEEDFEDLLGYNIYRWTEDTIKWNRHYDSSCKCYIEAGWKFDTICINSSLIDAEDTKFIDYDVIPGKDYYYVIRQMTTSLDSYDLSNPVVARPLTAIKGDANGSMSVDVADVITEVNYITHQNPQPFIFEAADVNNDNAINIFDVVGTINIIRHPEAQSNAVQDNKALYYIENGILYVETDVVLGGVQFTFTVDSPHVFTPLEAMNGFEMVSEWTNSKNYLFMAYSMSGKTIGVGKNALLQIGDAELTSIALSDTQGHNVQAIPQASTALDGTLFMPCSTKYIKDGHLYIKIGDKIYTSTGIQIQ